MEDKYICKHCKGDTRIRNPKGFCDHLYYPEYCEICSKNEKGGKMKINLNPFNKEFGHRLWGMAVVLWVVAIFRNEYPFWARILSGIVISYFIINGVSRFDKEYRKII